MCDATFYTGKLERRTQTLGCSVWWCSVNETATPLGESRGAPSSPVVVMKRGRDIASCLAPGNQKGREPNEGVEEQEEGEPEESGEVGERACDEREGSDTEREIPEGEEDEEEGEEEEEENLQGQREEQPEGQQVDPCGSSTAPSESRVSPAAPVDICWISGQERNGGGQPEPGAAEQQGPQKTSSRLGL
ncbi:histone H3.v1-like [Perca flavescens]|uniref:histone H3.v1-like n=1 Tax=Perca flavescens TaxID=8167 RepID=UPI00106E7323|nr:histone H3.v1-like [Perca flavescens]